MLLNIKFSVLCTFYKKSRIPENYTVNSRKKFLEMRLDHMLFVGLSKDLQKIFITKKVEPGKSKTLFLENQTYQFFRAIYEGSIQFNSKNDLFNRTHVHAYE